MIMKRMAIMAIGLCLASAVSEPASAAGYVKRSKTLEASANISKQSPDRCSVSAMDDWATIDAQISGLFDEGETEATVSFTATPSENGRPRFRFDHKWPKVRTTAPGSAPGGSCDNTPSEPAQDLAIKTKGVGGDRTKRPIVVKDMDFTCDVSGDESNPVIAIRNFRVYTQNNASVQDISFTRSAGTGQGAIPHVMRQDETICSTASGEASSISALLLPAVQK
jgi:hypothetical protein